MFRRSFLAAVVVFAVASVSTAAQTGATTDRAVSAHKLIVAVEKTLGPKAEKKLAVLVIISQNGGPPAAAVATASKPLTILQSNSGLYRVKAELDVSCRGSCETSYRISGSANHKLQVIPSCRLESAGFVCSRVKIVKVY